MSEVETAAIKAAAEAVNKHSDSGIPREMTLSNGIRVSFRPMPPMLLNAAANSVPRPKVPKVYIEEKEREEENPNHPDYLAALAERDQTIAEAVMNVTLYTCVKVEEIPEGIFKPEEDEWLIFAKMANISFNQDDTVERWLAWLKFYALATVGDLNEVQMIPLRLSGVSESEVAEAMESFRGNEGGATDNGVSPDESGSYGDNIRQFPSGDGE